LKDKKLQMQRTRKPGLIFLKCMLVTGLKVRQGLELNIYETAKDQSSCRGTSKLPTFLIVSFWDTFKESWTKLRRCFISNEKLPWMSDIKMNKINLCNWRG